MNLGSIAKAIAAGATAFGAAYSTANLDGVVTQSEWITIAIATAAGLGLVYTVPNATKSDTKPEPDADDDSDVDVSELDAAKAALDAPDPADDSEPVATQPVAPIVTSTAGQV